MHGCGRLPSAVPVWSRKARRSSRSRRWQGGVEIVELGRYSIAEPNDEAVLMRAAAGPSTGQAGVLVCHAAGQRADEQSESGWWPVPMALARSGRFVCLACDLGNGTETRGLASGPQSWGSDHAVGQLSEARELLRDPRVRASGEEVVVAATSMGALVALNWVRRRPQSVAAVLLGCPVLDLEAVYWNDKGGLRDYVAAAHGIRPTADPESVSRILGDRSPVQFAADLEGVPMRLYASSDDPIGSDTERCVDWVKTVGGDAASVIDLGATGHWPVGTPADDAVAFASRFL